MLDYEGCFLCCKKLIIDQGEVFVLDLEQIIFLDYGDVVELVDGCLVEIKVVFEVVLIVIGENFVCIGWYIGNCYMLCQIEVDCLLI